MRSIIKKGYKVSSRVFDITNQLLTRHSPFAPLGQVDECRKPKYEKKNRNLCIQWLWS